MATMLENIRKLNWVLQEAPKGDLSFTQLCEILCDLTAANVYIIDMTGNMMGVAFQNREDAEALETTEDGEAVFPREYGENFGKIDETVMNLRGDEVLELMRYETHTNAKYHTIIPIIGGGQRRGTMLLARYEPEFSEEDVALAEVSASVIGLVIQRVESMKQEEEAREEEIVRMAISTLSYSETEAVQKIFEELNAPEGILVASKIADKSRITRSVIVNALRKLESAGVIDSKSLGMKGTHIKVLNDKFYDALKEMK